MRIYPYIFRSKSPKYMRFYLNAVDFLARFTKIPGVTLHPFLWERNTDIRWLPVNERIEMAEDMPMPLTILDRIIEEASHRMIYRFCACREAYDCKDYPHDIGCLMMGDAAAGANPEFCREVSVDEAKEYARKAVDSGLVPFVGPAKVDEIIFGINGNGRLLTACFCCECCCITRCFRRFPKKSLHNMMVKLDGVSLEVTDACTGCGTCVDKCYLKTMAVVDGKAVPGDLCTYCGRCATVCPNDAIKISLNDPDYVEKTIERIRSYVKYD